QTIESIAARESKSERSIRMTLSLAFLSPDLVKSAIDGRLPRGFGLTRLIDLPIAWSDQWAALGLTAPARTSSLNDARRLYRRTSPRSWAQRALLFRKIFVSPNRREPHPGKRNFVPRDFGQNGRLIK